MLKISQTFLAGAAILVAGLVSIDTAQAADAEQVYQFYCAQCHGAGGKGDGPNVTPSMPVTPRNFTKPEDMNKLSDAELRNVIMDGGPSLSKSAIMPPWSKTLDKEEADVLVAHIRKLCNCKGKQ
ncbi:MAG: c-type cytochrome [Magnetococcus sp. DMHC-8]